MIPSQWSPPGHEIYLMANKTKASSGKGGKVKKGMGKKVQAPVAQDSQFRSGVPRMRGTSNGLIVSNTERFYSDAFYLANGPANSKSGWPIGPGPTGTFGGGKTTGLFWASSVGQNYQYYRFLKAIFHFRPRVPTSFEGTQTLGILYDHEDFINWSTSSTYGLVSQAGTSVTGQFWDCMQLVVDVKRVHTRVPWFLFDPVSGTADHARSAQAHGAYFAWETSIPSIAKDTYIGDWFLEYEIEFIHPTPATYNVVPPQLVARMGPVPDYPPYWRQDPLPKFPQPPAPPKPEAENEAEELEY